MTPEFIAWQQQPGNPDRAKAKEQSLEREAARLGIPKTELHAQWTEAWRNRGH